MVKFFWVEADTPEELETVKEMFAGKIGNEFGNGVTKESNAEKQKRYRERKKTLPSVTESVTNVTESVTEEKERDEKEGVLPLDSPSSLLSSPPHPPINYPITPFNPPLPEERGERERDDDSGAKPNSKPKPEKKRYGSAKNVLLTDEEYEKLKERFPDADDKIEAMSLYFESKGNAGKYKSHYATFLNWERMAREREQTTAATIPKAPKEKTFGDIRREMEQQKTDSFVDSFWRD